MNVEINWEVDATDVGINHNDYDTYVITTVNINDDTKEIWSVNYSYIWSCGDGCCSGTETDIAYVGELSQWIKKRILEKLPGYKFQNEDDGIDLF